jgi:hypothetical protein
MDIAPDHFEVIKEEAITGTLDSRAGFERINCCHSLWDSAAAAMRTSPIST